MRLAAQDTYGVVVVLQAMDAAGKDGTIRHVMSGVNPQGVQVSSFKVPSSEDLDHDYLWRYARKLPERGNIGIFNRSYYEEVLVVRVHPQILASQKLPPKLKDRGIWKRRFREINDWEHYLTDQGYRFVKLFLNVSQGGAAPPVPGPHRRARPELEVQRERRQGAGLLGRLPEGVQRGAVEHEHDLGALVRHPGRRQAVRPGRRGRRPRPHPDRDRPAVPEGPGRRRPRALQATKVELEAEAPDGAAPDPIEAELAAKRAKAARSRRKGKKS